VSRFLDAAEDEDVEDVEDDDVADAPPPLPSFLGVSAFWA
jgi:hypothetical protein